MTDLRMGSQKWYGAVRFWVPAIILNHTEPSGLPLRKDNNVSSPTVEPKFMWNARFVGRVSVHGDRPFEDDRASGFLPVIPYPGRLDGGVGKGES
jgi:hypothetical protein